MSALARYFLALGFNVSGYDKTETLLTKNLINEGVKIHYQDNLLLLDESFKSKKNTLVIVTPAIPKNHSEWIFFKKQGFEILKRAQVLGKITEANKSIGIAGTHGKTTISSLVSYIFKYCKIPFTAFLGGISKDLGSNYYYDKDSQITVIEADEYDRSFLELKPYIATVSAIDPDHLDIYNSNEELKKSFNQFANNIKTKGKLFSNENTLFGGISYGFSSKCDYFISNYSTINYSSFFDINHNGSTIASIKFNMPGKHNALNALVAFAISKELNIDNDSITSSLSTFLGVKRRFSYALRKPKIIIDDYAHHPSEIKVIYDTIKDLYPEKTNTAIFQPHLYSRTRDFISEFAEILSKFDNVILTDIYPAREKPILDVSSSKLLELINNKNKSLLNKSDLPNFLSNSDSDVFVIMGAGDIADEVELIKNKFLN